MPREQILGQVQFAPYLAHLVLVEQVQRFDDPVLLDQLLNPGHAVVVGLDQIRLRRTAAFDCVGVDGPLAQDPILVEVVARFEDLFLHGDEHLADDVALALRVGDASQRIHESVLGVFDGKQAPAQRLEDALDELRLALAHQSRVHIESADTLFAQRPQAERESDRRIDSAGNEEEDLAARRHPPDLVLDPQRLLLRVPVLLTAGDFKEEVRQNLTATLGMHHLGMKLHAVKPSRRIANRCNGARFGPAEQ